MVGRSRTQFGGKLRKQRNLKNRARNYALGPLEPSEIVADAESVAVEEGLRFTSIRRYVLQTLAEAGTPMKAYDILKSIGKVGSESPPTVYRALDFLTEMGAIRRVDSLNAYVALRFGTTREEVAFAICDGCSRVDELPAEEAFKALYTAGEQAGFHGLSASIELRVRCAECLS